MRHNIQPENIWQDIQSGSEKALESVIKEFSNIAKKQAVTIYRKIHKRMPGCIELEDLISEGMIGLYQAALRFDPKQNTTFVQYSIRRIHGQIMDFVRKNSFIPRKLTRLLKQLEKARAELQKILDRDPTDDEIQRHLNIDENQYRSILGAANASGIVSLDEMVPNIDGETTRMIDTIPDAAFEHIIDDKDEMQETLDRIDFFIRSSFKRRTREVIFLIVKDYSYTDIAKIYDITESRVSQLFTNVVNRIKQYLTQASLLRILADENIIRPSGNIMPTPEILSIMEERGDNMRRTQQIKTIEMVVTSRVTMEVPTDYIPTLESLLGLSEVGFRMRGQILESIEILGPKKQSIFSDDKPIPLAATSVQPSDPQNSPRKKRGGRRRNSPDKIDVKVSMANIKKYNQMGGMALDPHGAEILDMLIKGHGKRGVVTEIREKYNVPYHTLNYWMRNRIVYKV